MGSALQCLALAALCAHGCAAAPPPPALLWECASSRLPSQAWTLPTANSTGLVSLHYNSSAALTVLGWPAFAHNLQLLTAGPPVNATPLAFTGGSLRANASSCLGALYGVPFHGAGVGAESCDGGPTQQWRYEPSDGTLRPALNASLCLDFGSTFTCARDGADLPYCDGRASAGARAADLSARLGAAELSSLLSSGIIVQPLNYGTNLGLPARGLPPLWWSECCHGAVASCGAAGTAGGTGCPTSLPAGLATGASLNSSAWALAGRVVSTEARALANQGLHGLGCFAPNVNPFRAPQWGRGAEVPSEDPLINGRFGAAFAGALQGEGEASVLRVLATLKHGTAYDMEDSNGQNRGSFNAIVTPRDLAEFYWAPFRTVAQHARPRFMMASYNALNGIPSCANGGFMNDALREEWGFGGATITDCGGLEGVLTSHHYTQNETDTVRVALAAGLDSECGSFFAQHGAAAVAEGAVDIQALRRAAQRTLTAWLEVGLLPGVGGEEDPYAPLGGTDVDTPSARALALDMAVQGAALLRNAGEQPLLPLAPGAHKRVAVVGPHATSTTALLGPYSPPQNALVQNSSLAGALAQRGGVEGFTVTVAQGCASTSCPDDALFPAALAAAAGADLVVAAFGMDGSEEGEGRDRKNLTLPGRQEALLAALGALGKPLVLVLVHGGPLALGAAANATAFPAVLSLFYPGQFGGQAAARLLFGDASPSGRTLVTWYPARFNEQRAVVDMLLQPHGDVPGITYKWYSGEVLFPFGVGGSYTTFSYAWCSASGARRVAQASALAAGLAAPPSYCVNVTNTGQRTSDVSVLAFLSSGLFPQEPLQELFDFGRLAALAPGETRALSFSPDLAVLASGRTPPLLLGGGAGPADLFLFPGSYNVTIGDTPLAGGTNFVSGELVLEGISPCRLESF
jgi:beta-D-xylosidase 4